MHAKHQLLGLRCRIVVLGYPSVIVGEEAFLSGRFGAAFEAVNPYLGNLKRSLGATYRAIDFAKYSPRYLAEARFRFNRRCNPRSMLARLLRAACVIRVAEVGC